MPLVVVGRWTVLLDHVVVAKLGKTPVEREVSPGRHTLLVRAGTLFRSEADFEVDADDVVTFECVGVGLPKEPRWITSALGLNGIQLRRLK